MNDTENDRATSLSPELLNAFVDDQLDGEEKQRVFLAINQNEQLGREVCELRKVRDLMHLAYRDVPHAPRARLGRWCDRRFSSAIAAGIGLLAGVTLGWFLNRNIAADIQPAALVALHAPAPTPAIQIASAISPPAHPAQMAALVAPQATPPANARAQRAAGDVRVAKVLVHVNTGDYAQLGQTLADIENLAQHYRTHGEAADIEVVINGDGLALVNAETTPYAARIGELLARYDNVRFAACQNTISQARRERGVSLRLLPNIEVIDSGVAEIMRRQQQGWAYLHV